MFYNLKKGLERGWSVVNKKYTRKHWWYSSNFPTNKFCCTNPFLCEGCYPRNLFPPEKWILHIPLLLFIYLFLLLWNSLVKRKFVDLNFPSMRSCSFFCVPASAPYINMIMTPARGEAVSKIWIIFFISFFLLRFLLDNEEIINMYFVCLECEPMLVENFTFFEIP